MNEFVVICNNCGNKDIVELRRRMVSTQRICRKCHTNRWLKVIGKIRKFGENAEYTKIDWYAG